MAKKTNPYKGVNPFSIRANPETQEQTIKNHGQYCRVLKTRVCPCNKNGKPDPFHELCGGLGFLYTFQTSFRKIEEKQHYHLSNRLELDNYPILEVEKITRMLAQIQGGNVEYQVKDFYDQYVEIEGEPLPKKYEWLKVTYRYDRLEDIYNENPIVESDFVLKVKDCEIDNERTLDIVHNPQRIFGDIVEVKRVYNRTKDWHYNVLKFFRQTIILDDEQINVPSIEENDIIEVDYRYCEPDMIAATSLKINDPHQKWANIQPGDVEVSIPYSIEASKGDLFTFLFSSESENKVYRRSGTNIDTINVFDVVRFTENIIDEDGIEYKENEDFILYDYNKIKWIGNKPELGKQYNVSYEFKPTYAVWDREAELTTAENQQFPKRLQLRLYKRMSKKDIYLLNSGNLGTIDEGEC